MTTIQQWELRSPREPLVRAERAADPPGPGEALVRVAACGVCHTDLGFASGDVRTHHALPLVLGHEISGTVEAAGAGAESLVGRTVVVPAILPCGTCAPCGRGMYALCPRQVFPGNDVHGGFASHVIVPARDLCEAGEADPRRLAALSVVADAVSTPYEAVERSGLSEGEVAVFVGAGGVGGFGVQIAAARGAAVIAVDPSEPRRRLALEHGARLAIDPAATDASGVRRAVRDFVKAHALPDEEWKIFETSGTPAGQELAFALLTRGSHLGVVGFTPRPATVVVSRLMALDARAVGSWGCAPRRYPEILRLVREGRVVLDPFLDFRPMSEVNAVLAEMADHRSSRRAVLLPDFA